MLQNVGFAADLQSQSDNFINSHFLHIFMKMNDLLFPNMHVREENISVIPVLSFCHPEVKTDLLCFVKF